MWPGRDVHDGGRPHAGGMPFTVSHVAAVLPLRARPGWAAALPAAPLVIGSMAPDLPTAAGLPGWRSATHGLVAAISLDVAITLVLVAVWVLVLRPAVADALPALASRWAAPRRRPTTVAGRWRGAAGWYVAAALGSLTHVLWDGLTHGGEGVALWPVARNYQEIFPVLQLVSSVLGLAVLAVWAARWWADRRPAVPARPAVRARLLVPAATVAATTSAVVAGLRYAARAANPVASVVEGSPWVEAAFGALSGLLGALVLLALLHRVTRKVAEPAQAAGRPPALTR